jgi:hypothetical protein
MSRPDAALALALLYGFQGKRESRMGAVCVNGAGLGAAIFCNVVERFYSLGPPRNANQVLPVGLAPAQPAAPDPPMIVPVVARRNDSGDPFYARTVRRFTDTSVAEAVLRNGVIFNREAVVILSAPATSLARSLDLQGVKEIYQERVKRLVIVDAGVPQDAAAMRKVLTEWPSPVFFCGREVGEALKYPGERIEKDFAWAPAHPVADAYRAFHQMPYDAPSYDLAAAHFAVHPDSGFFKTSDPGTLTVADDGSVSFAPGGSGKVSALSVDPARRDQIIEAFAAVVSAKPVAPPPRFRRPQKAAAQSDAAKPAAKP